MAKIFAVSARAVVARISDTPARALLRAGVSPNVVTAIGTLGVIAGSLVFAFTGNYLAGTIIVTLSAFTDLLDGAMARARGPAGKFGAFLDSTATGSPTARSSEPSRGISATTTARGARPPRS